MKQRTMRLWTDRDPDVSTSDECSGGPWFDSNADGDRHYKQQGIKQKHRLRVDITFMKKDLAACNSSRVLFERTIFRRAEFFRRSVACGEAEGKATA